MKWTFLAGCQQIGLVVILMLSFTCPAQDFTSRDYYDFGFERDFSIQVMDDQGDPYQQPWIGGLNACQFSEVDLDLDGRMDLVVFDRHGNRILPFLNGGLTGQPDYAFAPEFIIRFPVTREWMNLVDYNCDGKNDLFTYTTGGIRVYKNISDTALTFELAESLLYSYYFNGYVNLFALTDDYPVFSDIDGDGDMDILNFFSLGKYLNYHKNLSMEKYGVCDSLDFRLTELCWGYFEESELSNILMLNITCENRDPGMTHDRHAGSTLLALDMDADQDKELLVGDVDYSSIIGLSNGGTTDSAHMIGQDSLFPSHGTPIDLMSMPVCNYLDINNDAVRDLLVSPFDPGLDRSENDSSVWLYKNSGEDNYPVFSLEQKDFLQEWMIDVGAGAYPVIYDVNQDGLQDLVVGNFGYLDSTYYSFGYLYLNYRSQVALFMNTGTPDFPQFRLADRDFGGLSSLMIKGAVPAMADLDNDGDADMLVGNSDGTLIFLENTAGPGQAPAFGPAAFNYQQIDVGENSVPQLIDLDRDTKTDLVLGKRDGTLSYYRNTGTKEKPVFVLMTELLGGVDVTDINLSIDGFSTPCFFESSGEYRLFVGSEFGSIYYFKDIEGNLAGTFTLADDHYLYIDEGSHTALALWNFNGDMYPDLMIGNYSGGLASFSGTTPPELSVPDLTPGESRIRFYPNPVHDCLFLEMAPSVQSENMEIHITDIIGRRMFSQRILSNSVNSVYTGTLSRGIYFLSVVDQSGILETHKLVVY